MINGVTSYTVDLKNGVWEVKYEKNQTTHVNHFLTCDKAYEFVNNVLLKENKTND